MKKISLILTIISFVGINLVHAQKAKFKSKICSVQKTKLPKHYSEPDQRTFDVVSKGLYAGYIDPSQKRVYGWERDRTNPNVKAQVSIYGYTVKSPQRHSAKKTKKDKDGKVTSSWTEYHYTGKAVGNATLRVYGLSDPFEFKPKNKKPSKYEEKKKAEAEQAKKELESNPFLSDEVIEEAEESEVGEDSGLEGIALPLVTTVSLDKTKEVKTGTHRSGSAAYKDYIENQKPKLLDYRSAFPKAAYKSAMHNLNSLYGFAPVKNRFYLRTMKSDKHPELKMWNNACTATETIFKTFKYNESIDKRQTQFDPIVDYFASQVKKISEDDKKGRKQKKAAFQNLIDILYYLDRHDEVITLTSKYLNSKKLDKVSKRAKERSEKTKAHLAFHGMNTCHFETDVEAEEDDIETGELEADIADEGK